MTQHTIKNLRDVEDSAPKFGMAPAVSARFAATDLGMQKSAISLQKILPNETMPFGHQHRGQEELYVVLHGSGRVKLDDAVYDVKELDAVRVAPEVMRAFSAGPEGLEYLAYGAPAVTEPGKDVEMEPGWFGDTTG